MKSLMAMFLLMQSVDQSVIEQKSETARWFLEHNSVGFTLRGGRIISRESLFAAYHPASDSVYLARIEIPVPSENPFRFEILTPGFLIEHIKGSQLIRLELRMFEEETGDELIVLDSRQIYAENGRREARDLFYRPYSDFFQDDYYTQLGLTRYRGIIREAQNELCDTGSMSRAYPGTMLCKVVHDRVLEVLGVIEQTADGEFNGECPADDCAEYAMRKFFAHLARNGEHAFSYSISVDGARGLMQFMNSQRIPTYDVVRRRYPEINFVRDYEPGTADMKNSIRAAIALLDMNLAELPEEARVQFVNNPYVGGIVPVAAHNTGVARARRLWYELDRGAFNLTNFPTRQSALLPETVGFIRKYLVMWAILDRWEEAR